MALDVPYRSIPDMFRRRVAATPDRAALGYPTPDAGIGWFTWAEAERRVTAIAAGLIGLGVAPEDRVAILCSTRVEWILADFGVMCAGAATTAIYPTTEPDEAVFIVRDSGSTVLIAENAEQTAKVAEADLAHVIVIDGEPDSGQLSLAELERRGAAALEQDPGLVDRVVESVRPDQLATLIDTSGTTGRPKGVELLHGGWCWEGVAQCEEGLLSDSDLHYLWLPLSHSFGKALVCGLTHGGVQTYVDGRVDRLVDNLSQVRPTLMAAPPRIYEKIYNVVVSTATADGGVKARIFEWAVHVGTRAAGRPAGDRRPAGLHQAARPPRRPHPHPGLRRGPAVQGDRAVLRGRAPSPHGGVRPVRDQRRQLRQPPGAAQGRQRRAAAGRPGVPHRRGRRDPATRRAGHARLPQPARRDRRRLHRRRLLPHRRHR